jgi:RNA polymerase sigma-70 factor (ECF subfamily)
LAEPAPVSQIRRGARRTLAEMTQRLRGLLRRKGQSSEDAEDLAQDALLKLELYQRAQDVRDPEAFLRRTAVNQAIDQSRRSRRSPLSTSPLEAFDLVDPSPTPDDLFAANRSLERLTAGLKAMNAKSREVLLAQRLDGLTYAQIAEQFGISQSAVEKRLARGMLFLQDWMEGW